MTDECGAMVNDEWEGKTEETWRQASFVATSKEENKFLSGFLSWRGVLPVCCKVLNAQDIHHQRSINENVV